MTEQQFWGSLGLCFVGMWLAIQSIGANPLTRWHKIGLSMAFVCCMPLFIRLWIAAIAG